MIGFMSDGNLTAVCSLDIKKCFDTILICGREVVRVIIIIGGISGDLAGTFYIQCGWLCAVL